MQILLYVVITLLVLIILILSIALLRIIKKATYLSKKEKEMANFAINMYIEYGKEIGITPESDEEYEILVNELERLKNKIDG